MPNDLEPDLALQVHVCARRFFYKVTFTGPNADARAAAFIEGRSSTCAFELWDDETDMVLFPLTAEALWPTCEHGLSLALCAGPGHYPMEDEDRF